jgi:hypothetical protein
VHLKLGEKRQVIKDMWEDKRVPSDYSRSSAESVGVHARLLSCMKARPDAFDGCVCDSSRVYSIIIEPNGYNYISIYIYIYMYIYIYVFVYIYNIQDVYVYVCMCVCIYMYTRKRIRACLCVLMCVSIHINDVCRYTPVSVNNKIE